MSAYHLRKTEVIYELKIRSLPTEGNAGDLRKRLSQTLATNTPIDDAIVNAQDTDAELEECEVKYQDLSALVSDYEGNHNDNEYHRIVARIWHLYLRVQRIPVSATAEGDLGETKDDLLSRCKELLDSFKDARLSSNFEPKVKQPSQDEPHNRPGEHQHAIVPINETDTFELPKIAFMNVEEEQKPLEKRRSKEVMHQQEEIRLQELHLKHERAVQEEKWHQEERRLEEEKRRMDDRLKKEDSKIQEELNKPESLEIQRDGGQFKNGRCDSIRPRPVPVYKWSLKFDNSGPSIAYFLERVEELRRARGITHQELYESAVDLFAGPALVWYRAAATRIRSWHQLTKELREAFQSADYILRLHQEIFNRVQGDKEPLDLYIAAMEGLYSRLAASVPETTRLAQIYNNLHPQLQDRLALSNILFLEQLISMGRRAEAGRLSMIRPRPAPGNETALKPDLAYHDSNCRRGFPQGAKDSLNYFGSLKDKDSPIINYVLQTYQKDPRPYLKVRVLGREITALLDSGASRTFLGGKGLWILREFPTKLQDTLGTYVETADSNRHEIKGFISLPITLQGRTEELSVCVVPSLQQSLILGIDFWEHMHIVTDMRNRKWDFVPKNTQIFCSSIGGITSGDNLAPEERGKLQELIEGHFKDEPASLGRTDRVKHVIDTGDAQHIKQRYYSVSPARQKLINEKLDRMLHLGVVEPSQSAWSSPIMLLDKPDGSKRFLVDFRAVNAVSRKDAYPLHQVTTILDRLRDAKYLSSLDIKSAYWQIELEESSKEKTAFTIPGRRLYQFVTMPFGLCGAPATWQRLVDTEKSKFCRSELRYLGYVVSVDGLRVDPDKIKAIFDIPVPRNQKEVRQFSGIASWYRRFIPNFASRMHPLRSLLSRRSKFEWNQEAEQAFQDIKSCLITAPILSCPDYTKAFTISCDASGVGIAAVLSQEYEQGAGVVAYASRTLTQQEQKYSATERECLAVIWAVETFRPYVEGVRFTVVKDHYSLLWLNRLKDPTGRLARWALRLQPYDYHLVHRKGQDNVVPDLLSRTTPLELPSENALQCEAVEIPLDVKDKWYKGMLQKVEQNSKLYSQWRVETGKPYKNVTTLEPLLQGDSWRIVVPKDLRRQVLAECHDEPTAGHQGVLKTYNRIQQLYYWPKMRKDVATYVSRCSVCQRVKYDQNLPSGNMGCRRGIKAPWQMIAADLMGPLPRSMKGFKYLLVVTDTFTNYSVLQPLRAATAEIVAQHLENDIFMVYGWSTGLHNL
ncbi:uncharacterized protein LOC124372281 [Homalodisca vitripennis]|uniref:uncharacterized protein LOC124372281 n=1 Tax=Homalodisca vitripennis TaxID=197043 RepID=UPI001EEC192F|nr:uncharacterized protein LOC124372281 [Homalodisca vitripennis]